MKTHFIKWKKQWSAFVTINGLDVQEYGGTEREAREKLAARIGNSEFLLKGIRV